VSVKLRAPLPVIEIALLFRSCAALTWPELPWTVMLLGFPGTVGRTWVVVVVPCNYR